MNEEPHFQPGARRAQHQPLRAPGAADEAPLRAEPLSAAQLAVHGRQLAARHELARAAFPERLLARLDANMSLIERACAAFARAARTGHAPGPAADRLLEHVHLVGEHARAARRQLSPAEIRALPHLSDGMPRVYRLALDLVAHCDGGLEQECLSRFVAAYQEGAPLRLAELRALPAMLRLALVENLRRLAARLEYRRAQQAQAEHWAGRMIGTAGQRPGDLVLLMADMARAVQPLGAVFVAGLARRLQGRGEAPAQVLQWLDARLADDDTSIAAALDADHAAQEADGRSIDRSIASLRLLGAIDWRAFLETMSAVEQTLRQDPCGAYGRMDAASREHYRGVVERLARQSGHGETEVAAEALALAGAQQADGRTRHIGHYLLGDGGPVLRARLRLHAAPLAALRRAARSRSLLSWLGAIGALTLLFTAALLVHAWLAGAGVALLAALGLLAVCGASQLGQALTHMMAARLVTPRPLPRMDFGAGIPDDARTLVVVSAVLDSQEDAAALGRTLEVHYLANRDPNLRFCLLTDFADAPQEAMFEDAELLARVRADVAALNTRHATEQGNRPFLLLHRARSWNAGEGAWIGRDRRRGQLADLNAVLRGGAPERFALAEGNLAGLDAVRYVIVLDAGTRMPHDSARALVAALAHPLNRAVLDGEGRVTAGYGILQPRVSAPPAFETASRYQRLCGAGPGADRCGRGTLEVEQDLFGAGVFRSQGIYEVDIFERVLGGRQAEGQVLAHDLLAGCRLRAGLVRDVHFLASCPARYSDAVARRQRRIRGDWQLAGGLRARGPDALAAPARWMLFDRLRRSLVAPTLLAALLLCWALLPEPAFWTGAALAVFFLPAFLGMFVGLADKPHDMLWRQHLANWWREARIALGHAVLHTAFLPHRAWYGMDAVLRAGWRLLVSRRKLQQWRSTRLVRSSTDVESNWRSMWFAPALAVGTAVLLSFAHPFALFASAPLLLLWFLSPLLAWWISLPQARGALQLASGQTLFLTALARRTWGYFETVIGAQDNWLAPHSLQEHPETMLVHRTSPTGIGIGLLGTLSAWDFGFVAQADLLARLRAGFDSMALLERERGHFYEAYDTRTLAPLAPVRVSTVDSGNLAAHLLTLAAGLEQLADAPIASVRTLAGMRATLHLVEEQVAKAPPALREALARCAAALDTDSCRNADTLPGLADCLQAACHAAAGLVAALPMDADPELRLWSERLEAGCAAARADLLALAPWMRAVHEYVLDASLTRIPTLRELAAFAVPAGEDASALSLAALVEEGAATARARLDEIARLAAQARDFADIDFGLLYDPDTRLLATGHDVAEGRLDAQRCEHLASEARLASFIGIARGQLPRAHWFALKRQLGIVGGEQLLLSRDGALQDYLAPLLVMPGWRGTLLDETCRAIVRVQADHAGRHGVPWGFAACACNAVDAALRYRERDVGVPGAGLRRGLGEDLVVAPYAALLALMAAPEQACANLEQLAQQGGLGRLGLFEAIDYTGARLPYGQRQAIVRAYTSRHQGMGLLALSFLLHGKPMQRRFEADPQLQAALPLLQERTPAAGAFEVADVEAAALRIAPPDAPAPVRTVARPRLPHPEVQLLSNGRYHVLVTSDGGGYSRWRGLALTRWRADAAGVADSAGLSCCLRDLDSGARWSVNWQPVQAEPERIEALFPEGRALLRRREHGIELVTEIAVSPEDDVELRRMRIRNLSGQARAIELTSRADVLLAPLVLGEAGLEAGMPRLQAEILDEHDAVLCTRPSRGTEEAVPWLLNVMSVHGVKADAASCDTSRALAIRRVLTLAPEAEATVDLVLGVAATRAEALALVAKVRARQAAGRLFDLAWTHSQARLHGLGIGAADARLYGRLAGDVLYPQRALRADPVLVAASARGQPGLWPYGISGDHPLVLLRLEGMQGAALARQLVQAQAWWGLQGLAVDLVIWCAGAELRERLTDAIAPALAAAPAELPGGVFVFACDEVAQEDRVLMQAVARVVLSDAGGGLAEQLGRAAGMKPAPPVQYLDEPGEAWALRDSPAAPPPLVLDNGIGGFSEDGREYLVRTGPRQQAPAPWSNVLASPVFASMVSESGVAGSWSGNAHAFRLSGRDADPLHGLGGEAYYLRDEHSGVFWSPTALPAPSGGEYLTRHGFGYSVFEHTAHGIHSELRTFVALEAPLKYAVLRVRNDSSAPRRLSATGYVEWMLGRQGSEDALHVVTGRDPGSGALFARNAWNPEFADRSAFFHVDADAAFTCDRMEFIGRGRHLASPAALGRAGLSGAMGAALDPCAALQVAFELQPGERREVVFVLGVGEGQAGAAALAAKSAGAALDQVRAFWNETLGAMRVATPDPALDALANGWLTYQAIACRLWARSAGVVDFRAQLEDALALVHVRPQLLRAQLLECAARQFVEGDVQQWWQPPSGRGLRVRGAGDALWLPLAVCRYIAVTGDLAVLDESLPYLEGRALEPEEAASVDLPAWSSQHGDLYEHCARAIRHAMRFGVHGLPAAEEGGAESVQLGFVMAAVLRDFAALAERRADYGFATTCRATAQVLAVQLEEYGWNGAWYRRMPSDERAAEVGVQAWSVLSGVAAPAHGAAALAALDLGEHGGALTGDAVRAAMAFARLGQGERAWQLCEALNPLRRTRTQEDCARYRCEPYVMAQEIQDAHPHVGRGGGSWYTGSAGWMYRLIVEALLGIERQGERLVLSPQLPCGWPGFRLEYRYRQTLYEIEVRFAEADALLVDGQATEGNQVPLADDGRRHRVELMVARRHGTAIAAASEAPQSKSIT